MSNIAWNRKNDRLYMHWQAACRTRGWLSLNFGVTRLILQGVNKNFNGVPERNTLDHCSKFTLHDLYESFVSDERHREQVERTWDVPSAIAAIAVRPACRCLQSWLASIAGICWNAEGKTDSPPHAQAIRSNACSYSCGYVSSVGSSDGWSPN